MANVILIVFVTCLFAAFIPKTAPATTIPPPPTCDVGWISYDGHCYLVVEEITTWDDASDYCGRNGSYLIEITSDEERDFVNETILSNYNGKEFWIGATYRACDFMYKYRRTGEDVPKDYWAPGQPGILQEDCVQMALSNGDVEFYDEDCCYLSLSIYFVCEKSDG